jgi:hypothetical protein
LFPLCGPVGGQSLTPSPCRSPLLTRNVPPPPARLSAAFCGVVAVVRCEVFGAGGGSPFPHLRAVLRSESPKSVVISQNASQRLPTSCCGLGLFRAARPRGRDGLISGGWRGGVLYPFEAPFSVLRPTMTLLRTMSGREMCSQQPREQIIWPRLLRVATMRLRVRQRW